MILKATRVAIFLKPRIPPTWNCACYTQRHAHHQKQTHVNSGTLSTLNRCLSISDASKLSPRNWSLLNFGKYSTDNKYDITNKFATDEVDELEPEQMAPKPVGYFSSLIHVWRTPAPALLTGLAGLLPFIAAPTYIYCFAGSFYPFIISAQLAYGAVILSFVGGLRWGFVVPFRHGSTELVKWESIIQSTVPAMIAWCGLLVPDLSGGLIVVSIGLLLALYNDLRMFGDYPKWMMGLRCLLTTIAVATLIASVILVEENRLKNVFGGRAQNKLLDKEI